AGNNARFYFPQGIAADASGTLYVADTGNRILRKITTNGIVSTLAGLAGVIGNTDGTGTNARFNRIVGIAVDREGYIYVVDNDNNLIRKVSPDGVVSTIGQL